MQSISLASPSPHLLLPRPLRCFLALSFPLLRSFRAGSPRPLSISCSASKSTDHITARPSSELRRRNHSASNSAEDEKLKALRDLFARPGLALDAYIVPSQDAHQSEFIADCFQRRAYISGFTGSAGTAVVTKDKAALWTDGRYFLQAEKELGRDWILMRSGNLGVPTTIEWLNDVLDTGCRIGIDPQRN